jgi:hypothetical protein
LLASEPIPLTICFFYTDPEHTATVFIVFFAPQQNQPRSLRAPDPEMRKTKTIKTCNPSLFFGAATSRK